MSQEQPLDSLHGETAARRQAITELLFFASVGDVYRCRKIITAWALQLRDANCCDYDKRTPLHLAAAEGCFSVALWLLDQGVNVNPVDRFKRTPLEDAVRGDHGDIATMLIGKGGKVINREGLLVDLADSPLAGNVRLFSEYDPEWEIDASSLTIHDKIGEGEFGVVFKASWHGTAVAVKVLKETGAVALGDFRTELNVLQKVHHPHTVQFLGAVTKQAPYMIITEYMNAGSLADLFRSNLFPSAWRGVQMALDMARGLAYLHARSPQAVIHRDLKPANLLVGGPRIFNAFHRELCLEELGLVKIADFGLSKSLKLGKIQRGQYHGDVSAHSSDMSGNRSMTRVAAAAAAGLSGVSSAKNIPSPSKSAPSLTPPHGGGSQRSNPGYKLTGETGSYRYMAPEVFRHEPYNNKVDVYGYAMILYQLFEGLPPFWQMDPIEAARAASMEHRRPEWGPLNKMRQEVPAAIKDLVADCWAPDYDARPEFMDVVERLEVIAKTLQPTVSTKPLPPPPPKKCCSVQ